MALMVSLLLCLNCAHLRWPDPLASSFRNALSKDLFRMHGNMQMFNPPTKKMGGKTNPTIDPSPSFVFVAKYMSKLFLMLFIRFSTQTNLLTLTSQGLGLVIPQ